MFPNEPPALINVEINSLFREEEKICMFPYKPSKAKHIPVHLLLQNNSKTCKTNDSGAALL